VTTLHIDELQICEVDRQLAALEGWFARHLTRFVRYIAQRLLAYLHRLDRQLAALEGTVRVSLWRRAVYLFSRVKVNAKCPGCGHRVGRIEFSPQLRLIRHFCLVCGAQWGEQPLVDVKEWVADPGAITISNAQPQP
jgi:hypothetical protein